MLEETAVGTTSTVDNGDGTTSVLEGNGTLLVRMLVLEGFRGPGTGAEVIIRTNTQSSACGVSFEVGKEYLVYAGETPNGDFATSACTRTHELNSGSDPDIMWMRGLATAPSGATIYGRLTPLEGFDKQKLSGTIHLRGSDSREAPVNATGQYLFAGLPPGEYTVSATVPAGVAALEEQTAKVVDKGCAEVSWWVQYDGHIRGNVRDASGHPLAHIFVTLQQRDENFPAGLRELSMKEVDVGGQYDFGSVAPGEYLVSANELGPSAHMPYPRLYYPGTESAADALSVHVPSAGVINNVNFAFPKAWTTVTVHAQVVRPDGHPAEDAEVSAHDTDYSWSGELFAGRVGPDGRVDVKVYAGRSYYLTALVNGAQQRCGGPLQFTAADGMILKTLVIEHEWGNCLAQLSPNFRPPR